jgi:ferredoxin
MTYLITLLCVDLKDKTCIEECPVDFIYEGDRMLYICTFTPTNASIAAPASPSNVNVDNLFRAFGRYSRRWP